MLRSQPASTPLAIKLTEPITYLKSSATGEDFRGRRQFVESDSPPAILRGILTLRLSKPTRVKRIEVRLEGKSRTEWPEGIGPRRTETSEENLIISETLTFFNAIADAETTNLNRRALSIGPGIRDADSWDVEEEEEGDEDYDDFADERNDNMEDDRERGRGRNPTRAGPRSTSLMPMSTAGSNGPGFPRMQSGDITSAYHNQNLNQLQPPDSGDEPGPSGSSVPGPAARGVAERFGQVRGPSPAYALRDPLRPDNGSLARGRKTSPRRRMPVPPGSGSGRHSSENDERDITDSVLSPIASVEGSRFPSPADADAGMRTRRSSRSATLDAVNGNGGSGPSDSEESGSDHQHLNGHGTLSGLGVNGAETTPSARSSLSRRSRPGSAHIDGTASPHPLNAAIFSAHPSTNNSRTSIQASSQASPQAHPLVEVTRSGSNRSSLVELTPAHLVEAAAVNGTTLNSSNGTTGLAGHLASLRHRSSQGSMSQRTPSGTGSPADSTHAVHQYGMSQPHNSAPNGQPERGRKGGKFSIANALRSISRATSTSRTRQPSQPPPCAPSSHFMDHSHTRRSSSSHPMDGRMQMLAVEDREIRPFGRGGAGRSPSRTRALSPVQSSDRSDSRGRGRGIGMKVLGLGNDEDLADGGSHNWKEFKKGVYNYPISFPIPPNAPPTIHADFGSVSYRLTATVHRPGALSPNYIEEIEVCMVATPQEDDMEETENILVERQWEDQMRYLIALSGKAFTIGGQIPISIRIMPMSKCKIFRISATIEEKIDYFAMERKVARHEAPKKYPLVAYKNADERFGGALPLLPIISESTDAVWMSPLAAMAVQARERDETEDDAVSQLLNPFGPWYLETMLQVPDCPSRIKFSTKHGTTNMTIAHWLKIVIRVQRGDDEALDSKGKRKQFDIIIETPLHLLDCRATVQNSSLPSYNSTSHFSSTTLAASAPLQSTCRVHRPQTGLNEVPIDLVPQSSHLTTTITRSGQSPNPSARGRVGRSVSTARARNSDSVGSSSAHGSDTTVLEAPDTLLERNIVFDRLMSGQESEQGESPPTYDEALQNRSRSRNPRGRSGSRLRTEIC